MRWLVRLLVLALVLVIAVGGVAAWLGVVQVPVVSDAFGMSSARDLGSAEPDEAAYAAWATELGVSLPSPAGNYTFSSPHRFSGSVRIDETIPEATILAIREFQTDAPGLRDVTVRFHDGYAEAAAFIDLAPYGYPLAGPVYAKFDLAVNGPRDVTVAIDALEFGRLGVPGDILAQAESAINDYLGDRLPEIDGLAIETLEFQNGAVRFAGTVPATYEADPPEAGTLP
jgi:hypothetical protein